MTAAVHTDRRAPACNWKCGDAENVCSYRCHPSSLSLRRTLRTV